MARTRDRARSATDTENQPAGGALSELIEVEERIEAEVAEAEASAARLVEEARHDARRLDKDGSDALEQALWSLRASIEEEAAASAHALAKGGEDEALRYRRVDEATVGRLARWVASRVVEGSGAS